MGLSWINTGTASVASGSKTVTGQGTTWLAQVRAGYEFGKQVGLGVPVESVDSDTQITLAYDWPGPDQVAAPYRIAVIGDPPLYQETTRKLFDQLSSGVFFQFDASGTLAERSQFDAKPRGFAYLDTSADQLYFKASDTSGDWAGPYAYAQGEKGDTGDTGPRGPQGPVSVSVGTTTTEEPGSSASVTNAGTADDLVLDFAIPQGEKGDKGDPGTGDMSASVYDPQSKAADAFDMANMVEGTDAKVMTAGERTTLASALQQADIVGTVSNGGRKVIEQGSNANGTYTRWADGTQECRQQMKATYVDSATLGCTWTFPAVFVSNDSYVFHGTFGSRNPDNVAEGAARGFLEQLGLCETAHSATVVGLEAGGATSGAFSSGDFGWLYLHASGRWF